MNVCVCCVPCAVQLVVDWLEHSVSDVLENFYDKVDFRIDKMGAW